MQSKGAGPVNRVELESQVLCAALRQSCHLRDRVGSFTSVRELSHLFPDLLPPPEKHDEVAQSNKANYYGVLGVRPQSSANSVIAAYLRTVRAFLRTQRVADSRVEYNRILNAGFILRKPRLRLSHDLVVTRRWLHEESRLSQIASQEVTLDRGEAIKVFKDPIRQPLSEPAAAQTPQATPAPVSAPQPSSVPPMPPLPVMTTPPPAVPDLAPPHVVPAPPAVPAAAVAEHQPSSNVPPMPQLPNVASSAASEGFRSGVEVPPVPPLPVTTAQPPVVPPVPNVVNEYWDKQQSATAVEPPPVVTVPAVPPMPQIAEYAAPEVAAAEVAPPYPVPESPVVQKDFNAYEAAPVPAPEPTPQPAPVFEQPAPVVAEAPPTVAPAPPPPAVPVQEPPVVSHAPQPLPVVDPGEEQIEVAPGVFVPASSLAHEAPQAAPPAVHETAGGNGAHVSPADGRGSQSVAPPVPPTPVAPAVQPTPVAPIPPAAALAPTPPPPAARTPEPGDFQPAAVRAQQMPPAQPPAERGGGRISKEGAFVFDESALAPPTAPAAKKVPVLIQLLEAAQFITPVEVQALIAQMAFAPNIPVEKLILNAGYITAQEMASVKLGESLLQSGKINMAQFQVAIYDERTSGLRMAESLQVRGWLSVEVRNAIDEFHKKRS
jgi:hypothetical protein